MFNLYKYVMPGIFFFLILTVISYAGYGKTGINFQKEDLRKLKEKINEQIRKNQRKPYRQFKYLREFSEIEFTIAVKKKNLLLAELMARRMENEIHSIQAEIGKLKLIKKRKQKYYQKRVRDLYKVTRQPFLAILLSKRSVTDMYIQLEYLQALVKKDRKYIKDYEKLVRFWLAKKNKLEKLKIDVVLNQQEIWSQKDGLGKDLEHRKKFLSGLKRSRSVYSRFLNEINKCNKMLHVEVSRMNCNPEGVGLDKLLKNRGLLLPVPENMLKNGKNRWMKEKFHPVGGGLETFLPEGTEIFPVAPGIVCFSDWFIGQGNVVVIDHGKKWLSLYTHCSSTLVDKGDYVEPGQVIAHVGDTSSIRGTALYFELLHDNRLISPLPSLGIHL